MLDKTGLLAYCCPHDMKRQYSKHSDNDYTCPPRNCHYTELSLLQKGIWTSSNGSEAKTPLVHGMRQHVLLLFRTVYATL